MARRKSSTSARSSTSTSGSRTQSTTKTLAQQLGKVAALVILLVLVLLFQRYCTVEPEPFGPDANIVSIDGDTLRAGNGAEYRIFGIDAPELKQTCEEANGKAWLCGRAAKVKLTKLIKGGDVTCEIKDTDRYGRNVGLCSAAGVPDVGEVLVREGYAIDLGGKTGYAYADVEREAREAKRGIWRGTFQRPSAWRQDNPRTD
jgi:endonuclease YncB( thermonuclease family)